MGRPSLTLQNIIERLKIAHGDSIIFDTNTYVNATTKAKFIDTTYGEFWAKPSNVLRGAKHYLHRYNRASFSQIKQMIYELHGDNVIIDYSTFKNLSTKARFVDIEYGEWWTLPGNVFQLGHSHPLRGHAQTNKNLRIKIDKILQRLYEAHGKLVTLDTSTYVDLGTKALFIDVQYGKWWAIPGNVINGTSHPERGRLKMLRSSKNTKTIKHWKTYEDLLCTGSYEVAFVNWCNSNHVDFDWQLRFLMPTNQCYYVDAYLKTGEFADIYVEIKGTWYRDSGFVSKKKWEWFHALKPNSQLWMKPDLVRLGIL